VDTELALDVFGTCTVDRDDEEMAATTGWSPNCTRKLYSLLNKLRKTIFLYMVFT